MRQPTTEPRLNRRCPVGRNFSGRLRAYNVTVWRKMLRSGDVVRVFLGQDLNGALTATGP